MRDLEEFLRDDREHVRFVLADIDDTISTEGKITSTALAAMEKLQQSGVIVIPVTGRPAGWCDHIARMWPVDAVVGENGAFYFRYLKDERRMLRRFVVEEKQRVEDRKKLTTLRQDILTAVPGAGIASDQPYREADLAIDVREDVDPVAASDIDKIVSMFRDAGAQAHLSSIHVNGWFGAYNKLSTTRLALLECFDVDINNKAGNDICVFVGDSPNDAPMFEFFGNSVGVANVRRFLDDLVATPTYVTKSESGAGFEELVAVLLDSTI